MLAENVQKILSKLEIDSGVDAKSDAGGEHVQEGDEVWACRVEGGG